MAAIEEHKGNPRYESKRRWKVIRMDMTPMVGLAFMLLTAFISISALSKQRSMEFTFPNYPTCWGGGCCGLRSGITFLLSKDNRLFGYEGGLHTGNDDRGYKTNLLELSYTNDEGRSLRHYLREKNEYLLYEINKLKERRRSGTMPDSTYKRLVREVRANRFNYTYLVKTDEKATYKNVIDVLDELNISYAGRYLVMDMVEKEKKLLEERLVGAIK